MATGRVLQFDTARGYGFVAADDGGEDVFLHASVFDGDPEILVPGKRVGFQVMAGDRGRKAFAVHLVADAAEGRLAQPAPTPHRMVPAQPTPGSPGPLASAPPAGVNPVSTPAPQALPVPDEEPLCDVLSPSEFRQEFTELLLGTIPDLTGQQILQARQGALDFAKKHGWIDG